MSRHYFYYFICYICTIVFTKAAYLRIYNDSIDKYEEFDLKSPLDLLKSPGYNATSVTVIYAFGIGGKADGLSVKTILGAYLRIGGYNVVLLNWEKEAYAPIAPIFYPLTAILKVAQVGENFGEALHKLVSAGLDLEKIHLIGFSLGAHLTGKAGQQIQKYNLKVPRITGLDPAAPLFDQGVIKPLNSDSARYVDVLHTNPGKLGSDESIATVDFWFNCEDSVQPGCETLPILDRARCSHDRSWMYFSEALENATSFQAISATDCNNWVTSNGTGNIVYVGENITLGYEGDFYLTTNNIQPYGREFMQTFLIKVY